MTNEEIEKEKQTGEIVKGESNDNVPVLAAGEVFILCPNCKTSFSFNPFEQNNQVDSF